MHHLILGYGYCGYYLAQELLANHQKVTAVSRQVKPEFTLPQLNFITADVSSPFEWSSSNTVIYYLIPPPAQGKVDYLLAQFLKNCSFKPTKVLYFGSSGVYGNHHGDWINEQSSCSLTHDRQYRRLDAENQWINFCQQNAIDYFLLRIGGIYGPSRIPLQNAREQHPIITSNEAPYINSIYVKDLVKIANFLALNTTGQEVLNIADGNPQKMGTSQLLISELLSLPFPEEVCLKTALATASPMKQEFILNSKRLDIEALKKHLGTALTLTDLKKGIKECVMALS